MSAETFEHIVAASQTSGDYNPTWKRFVKTRFFVPLARDGAESGQQFKLGKHPQSGKRIVTIAEDRQLLEDRGENAAHLHGAEIVKLLSPEVGILVALADRSFGIPAGLVARLKQSLEAAAAAKAKAMPPPQPAPASDGGFPSIDSAMVNTVQPALQKSARSELQQSIAQPAVQSVASPAQQPMAAAATSSLSLALEPVADAMPVKKAPSKSSGGYLDVAALKPRQVGIEDLGLEFYVPGAWKQTRSGKSLEFIDADGDLKLEAGGTVRSGRSVDQWLAMRVQTLAHDLPYMKQLGEAAPLEGEDWGDRVVARVVEFRGTAPGASEQQSCLLCCLRTDSVLASIVISADTDVFEANRALYKWLLPRANLAVREEDVIETDNVIDDGLQSHSSMVASGLRMILISALCNGVLLSQARGLHLFILLYVLVCAAGFGCFGLYRITQGLRFPTWAKVLFFIGMCLPVVSLILIVLLRWRARSFLREGGYGTRIWNLHEAIDNVNHDLRNTMAAALVLALPVYGMAHVAEKRLGLERKMVVFAAPDHSFSALMPESPTLKLGGPDGSDEQVWSGNAGGVAYNAGYTWITSTVEEPEQALRDFAKSRTRAMNWTMESSTDDEIEAHEARRVEATTANGDTVSAEYVLVEHRMFMFWVELPAKEKDGFKGEEFLESISLK